MIGLLLAASLFAPVEREDGKVSTAKKEIAIPKVPEDCEWKCAPGEYHSGLTLCDGGGYYSCNRQIGYCQDGVVRWRKFDCPTPPPHP